MREELEAVVATLKRMRDEGTTHLFLQDGTLEELEAAIRATTSPASRAPVEAARADTPRKAPVRSVGDTLSSKHEPEEAGEMELPLGSGLPRRDRQPAAAEVFALQPKPLPAAPEFKLPEGDKETRLTWLRQRVLECPVCNERVKPGKRVVFGVGPTAAEIFFCGEAPGADEEVAGVPFVGPAGQLLTRIIGAMGISRDDVYISNIMNWRPEMPTSVGNRPPTAEEMAYCLPYLRAQVEIVAPKVIVALGKSAVDGLLGPDPKRKMSSVRGQWQSFNGIPLMPTFHPSYLLRTGTVRSKRQVWEDMMKVMERVGLSLSDRQRAYFSGG